MKKTISLLLALTLLCLPLAGCGKAAPDASVAPEKVSVVVTVFPLYDWVKQIAGDTPLSLRLLADDGTDMHSFQPSVDDIVAISSCSLFLYVGGESDAWAEDALRQPAAAGASDRQALNLLSVLGDAAKTEEIVEGMQTGAEEAERDGGPEYDEHIWLSLRNARRCCTAIAEALGAVDPAHADTYAANAAAYNGRLSALDGEYRAAIGEHPDVDTLVFADRFPFRYLLEDYGLRYYAAFPGCEAETEASFETVLFLAEKMDELGLSTVLTTESPIPRLAETVAENTAAGTARIFALDSMQSVAGRDLSGGAAYLSGMEQNLTVLKEALKR